MCHIVAVQPKGPRGQPRLTENDLNSYENLILLCPTHHAIVDNQPETYTPDMLRRWKDIHEAKHLSNVGNVPVAWSPNPQLSASLVNQRLDEEIALLRRCRLFHGFDPVQSSRAVASKIVDGEYSGATDATRSRALAWCVRLMSQSEDLTAADDYLRLCRALASCPENDIAGGFILSQRGDRSAALQMLATIDTPMSRTAAFMIVSRHDGARKALDWLMTAQIDFFHLDADGKCLFLARQLELADWTAAKRALRTLRDEDLQECPFLHYVVAMTHLLTAVPEELRSTVLHHVPFAAREFPLAADSGALQARRAATRGFRGTAALSQGFGCDLMARVSGEYALWLELRDPDQIRRARSRLETELRDARSALRLVHLGFQFGLHLDIAAIEREIERQIAVNGALTQDAAIARFSIVTTQLAPAEAGAYIGEHFDDLSHHIDAKAMRFFQVEMFARAGLSRQAHESLEALRREGLTGVEEARLQTLVAESEGQDPTQALEEQLRNTNTIGDLARLVRHFEHNAVWDGVCQYGRTLFAKTHTFEDAKRFAIALYNTNNYRELEGFLRKHSEFLKRSDDLTLLSCLVSYALGDFLAPVRRWMR